MILRLLHTLCVRIIAYNCFNRHIRCLFHNSRIESWRSTETDNEMRICFEHLCLLFREWCIQIQNTLSWRLYLLFVFISVFRTIHCDCDSLEPESNKTTDYELFEQNRDVRSIADATVATIRGFYVHYTSVLSISRGSSNNLSYQKQSEILNRILLSTSTEISYTIEEPGHLKAAARVFNLFFVDGLDGFGYVLCHVHINGRKPIERINLQANFRGIFCKILQ